LKKKLSSTSIPLGVENWEELQVNIQNVTTQLFYFKNQGTISITRSLLRNISLRSFYDLDYDYIFVVIGYTVEKTLML